MARDKRFSDIKVRHPFECRPARPKPLPSWQPDPRKPILPHANDVDVDKGWLEPRLIAARDLGAVRVNFRIASYAPVSACFSEKAQRVQYFESHHETNGFRFHEISPTTLDLQYQPMTLVWTTVWGKRRSMTFDYAVETDEHEIIVGEDKATPEFFEAGQLKADLEFAELYLGRMGVKLERRTGGGLVNDVMHRVVKDIFDNRRSVYSVEQAGRVKALLGRAKGKTTLANVLQCIGGPEPVALNIAFAMMANRILALPLNSMPVPHTPVTAPRKAEKSALRKFLQQFAEKDVA